MQQRVRTHRHRLGTVLAALSIAAGITSCSSSTSSSIGSTTTVPVATTEGGNPGETTGASTDAGGDDDGPLDADEGENASSSTATPTEPDALTGVIVFDSNACGPEGPEGPVEVDPNQPIPEPLQQCSYVMNADGTGARLLDDPDMPTVRPVLSSDGGTVYYSSGRGGIEAVSTDGSGRRPITDELGAPMLSPDGSWIAADRSGPDGISVVRPDGSDRIDITSEVSDNDPSWSPDSTLLVFQRYWNCGNSGGAEARLAITNLSGAALRQVGDCTLPIARSTGAWSPDGATIAYCSEVIKDKQSGLVLITPDGANSRLVNGYECGYTMPAWSPDGTMLAACLASYSDRSSTGLPIWRIYIVDPDTQSVQQVGTHECTTRPVWASDGSVLLYGADADRDALDPSGEQGIYAVRLASATEWRIAAVHVWETVNWTS